jgi:hypothetical protein
MEQQKSWKEMREWCAGLLIRATGEDVDSWNRRIAAETFSDKDALREWLESKGVTGYAQWLLVGEQFGFPDYMLASPDELVEAQYADRPHLRPIYDAIVAAALALGPVTVQTRKTYVSLVTPKRTFAVVRATTRTRVDLGLRLDGETLSGRLVSAPGLANDTINLRLGLSSLEELDAEALGHLERAYRANL